MKPVHPCHLGKEPVPVIFKDERILLGRLASLESVMMTWEAAEQQHKSLGHRITIPMLTSEHYSGEVWLEYRYEWDNANYADEKLAWDAAVTRYEEAMSAWNESQAKRHHKTDENIDAKITKAEHRLANLIAVKAGKPLPFPNG
jgi:hypothetical protein